MCMTTAKDVKKAMWTDGIMGVLVGDALGNPVQFMGRQTIAKRGLVKGMESGGVFHMPAGCWTDDGSMTLATLDSLTEKGTLDLDDMMEKFLRWDQDGAYTPTGKAYDQGITCMGALGRYEADHNWQTCGRKGEDANGNGGLMRIMPVCLYAAGKQAEGAFSDRDAVMAVQHATIVTHNHLRVCSAAGIYYFMSKEILAQRGLFGEKDVPASAGNADSAEKAVADSRDLCTLLQRGMDAAVRFYGDNNMDDEFGYYARMKDLDRFAKVPAKQIRSSGYVVHTLEAAVWCLITTGSLEECLLKAVNLGDDADTVGAVAGGLAGLYYGYDNVPEDWRAAMKKREWLEEMCAKAAEVLG